MIFYTLVLSKFKLLWQLVLTACPALFSIVTLSFLRRLVCTDRFRNKSVTVEFDEVLSCFKLLQAALDIGGNNIDLDKTIICKIVLESFTYSLNEFK